MDILGLGVTWTTVIVCLLGAGYSNLLGYLTVRSKSPVNWKEVIKTFAIAIVAGIPLISAQISGLKDVSEDQQLVLFVGLLNQVAGLDFGVKRIAKLVVGQKPQDATG